MTDRLRSLHIKGMRTIQDVELVLAGNTVASPSEYAENLTVLIGENGVGKSSFIEALALLGKATSPGFMGDFNNVHGGLPSLLRAGSEILLLRANFEDAAGGDGSFSYELALRGAPSSGYAEVILERVELSLPPSNPLEERPLDRTAFKSKIWNVDQQQLVDVEVDRDRTLLSVYGQVGHPAVLRAWKALTRMAVYVGFDATPSWVGRETQRDAPARRSEMLQPFWYLTRQGTNLASCYFRLRNRSPKDWEHTLDLVRLGIGPQVEDLKLLPDPAGGRVALALKFGQLSQPVLAQSLSDGQLSYLAWVAAFRMLEGEGVSVMAIDEPETHLHPSMLARVVDLALEASAQTPVLLATHSNQLLDCLPKPAESVVRVSLNSRLETVVQRPNPEALADWLKEYDGYGHLRSDGRDDLVYSGGVHHHP